MTSQALISKNHCTLSASQKTDSEFNVQWQWKSALCIFLMFFFLYNKLLFAYNAASYVTYTTNTYATNITIHLLIQLETQTQLLYIACSTYKIFYTFFGQYITMPIQPRYTIWQYWTPSIFLTFDTFDV